MFARSLRAIGAGTLGALALGLSSCSSDNVGRTVPVKGTVTIDHRPLHNGTVTFVPDAKTGNTAAVSVAGAVSDGAYTLQTTSVTGGRAGAPAGWYKVTITPTPPMSHDFDPKARRTGAPAVERIARKYTSGDATPLYIEVKEGNPPSAYDLEATTR